MDTTTAEKKFSSKLKTELEALEPDQYQERAGELAKRFGLTLRELDQFCRELAERFAGYDSLDQVRDFLSGHPPTAANLDSVYDAAYVGAAAALYHFDAAEFARLINRLKSIGLGIGRWEAAVMVRVRQENARIKEFKNAMAPCSGVRGLRGAKARDRLITLAKANAEFLHEGRTVYARLSVDGHYENYALDSQDFKDWLADAYYEATEEGASVADINAAINTLRSIGLSKGQERKTFVRVGFHEGRVYIDLTNDTWQVVEVGPNRWKVIENAECPIIFKRADGAKPLPLPERGGNINDLRPLVNCADDDDFMLLVGTLVSALSPHGPYPLVGAKGEAGSAKSTTQRYWRSLVDPNTVPIPGPPSTPRDFAIAAADGWVFGLNNVSSIPGWMSDDLCRLSTGGGDRRRKLFTDAKQIAFSGMRPIMINSITDVIDRSDLADRTVTVNLPRIKEADRKDEVELDREFERLQPSILGCLLDGVAMALKRQEEVRVRLAGRLPRMASFIVWCEAAGPAFGWSEGEFLRVYKVALNLQNARLLETPLAQAIQALNLPWRGTATELWDKCKATGTGKIPADPARLRRELERLATPLRDALGISVDFERKDRARYIVITKAPLAEFTPQSRRFTVSTVRPSEPTEMDNAIGYHSNPAQGSSAGSASHTER